MERLVLYQKIYDFLLYIYPVVAKFPKYEKFTLQTQIKNKEFPWATSLHSLDALDKYVKETLRMKYYICLLYTSRCV